MAKAKSKTKTSKKSTAKLAKKVAKQVTKNVITKISEKKYFDTAATAWPTSTGSWQIQEAPIQFYNIVQGTTVSTRIGNKIRVTGISFKMAVTPTTATVNLVGDFLRMQVWMDKQCQGSLASIGDIYATTTSLRSFRVLEKKDRFKLMWSRDHLINVVQLNSGFTAPAVTNCQPLECEVYLPVNKIVNFKNNAGTIADIYGCNIFFTHCVMNGSTVTVNCTSRIYFTDV